jgi:hypothetical protein
MNLVGRGSPGEHGVAEGLEPGPAGDPCLCKRFIGPMHRRGRRKEEARANTVQNMECAGRAQRPDSESGFRTVQRSRKRCRAPLATALHMLARNPSDSGLSRTSGSLGASPYRRPRFRRICSCPAQPSIEYKRSILAPMQGATCSGKRDPRASAWWPQLGLARSALWAEKGGANGTGSVRWFFEENLPQRCG